LVRKDKLRRLERATKSGREMEVLKEIFRRYTEQLDALVAGEEMPPTHPRAAELARGTFLAGPPEIAGGGSGPVPDFSDSEE
jgi:hypothetical protein